LGTNFAERDHAVEEDASEEHGEHHADEADHRKYGKEEPAKQHSM
jgi:hypothetical protein